MLTEEDKRIIAELSAVDVENKREQQRKELSELAKGTSDIPDSTYPILHAECMCDQCKPQPKPELTPDNWIHRSTGMLCKTCMYYVPKSIEKGRCRRHAPTMSGWPVLFPTDWCGDHKLL
jgi:hypothetical protein